jgi:hypothetical protein
MTKPKGKKIEGFFWKLERLGMKIEEDRKKKKRKEKKKEKVINVKPEIRWPHALLSNGGATKMTQMQP